MRFGRCAILIFLSWAISACAVVPKTFVRTAEPGWKEIELTDVYAKDYEKAWQTAVDTIAIKYDIETMDKDSGYLRTGWIYVVGGVVREDYKSRITLKFDTEKDKLKIKVESLFRYLVNQAGCAGGPPVYNWEVGYDITFLEDVYGDLTGKLARSRR